MGQNSLGFGLQPGREEQQRKDPEPSKKSGMSGTPPKTKWNDWTGRRKDGFVEGDQSRPFKTPVGTRNKVDDLMDSLTKADRSPKTPKRGLGAARRG